jgi:hypothetical protein
MKIFIGGLNAAQSRRVTTAFRMLDLRIATSDDPPKKWGQMAADCDHVFTFGRFRSHAHDDHLKEMAMKGMNRPSMAALFGSLHDLVLIQSAERDVKCA